MSDPIADLRIGLQAHYTLERELGRGGMATVYLARDLRHDRPVALKVLHPELAHSLGPERFLREIKLAARLQHPHILTVLDSGDTAGQLWFTMPFVDGESLRDRLSRERQLPLEDAVRIATEVGRALDHAHRHDVIHRDIKPENILLTKDGDTLVADFGIARGLGGQTDERLTETGMAVGTPAYMSPEQASGERQLDARTDVYALGSVLYEMLAGEPPFTGATAQAVIAKRMRGEVPLVRAVRPSVPPAIEAAMSRALAPVPADRFPSTAEFIRALGSTSGSATPTPAGTAPFTAASTVAVPARRRVPAGFGLLLLGFLIGVGALFAWRFGAHSSSPTGTRTIAVLPFDNQGDSTQDYFADGITDEVRGKLTVLPGVQVIAGGSSKAYRRTDKPLAQVASELGADYLLMAKVRWAKDASGLTQVRVSPELIAVSGGRPTTKWQQGFDAALTNVFQVQTDIAGQVAQALGVALADSVSRKLAVRPTQNLPAYDAFLRGEQIFTTQGANDPVSLRRALSYYQQALALDSTFALAWARVSRAQSLLYTNGVPDPAVGEASRRSGERAVALDPTLADARLAMAGYQRDVRLDFAAARRETEAVLRLDPRHAPALSSLAALDAIAGRWDSAMVHAREATRLDPLSNLAALRVGSALRKLGRYAEARSELDRGLRLAPASIGLIQARVMVELKAGDLDSARALLHAASAVVDPAEMVAYFGNYWDLYWVLDDSQQQLLLTLSPVNFDGDRSSWALVMAQTLWVRGDHARARAYADTARIATLDILKLAPDDAQRLLFLGLMQAYLGHKAEALRNAERGVSPVLIGDDAVVVPYYRHVLARVYVATGEYPPLVNASLPGSWQSYDIVFRRPRFDSTGGAPRVRPNHRAPERRAHPGQCAILGPHQLAAGQPVRGGCRPRAHRAPGPRQSGALPEHLGTGLPEGPSPAAPPLPVAAAVSVRCSTVWQAPTRTAGWCCDHEGGVRPSGRPGRRSFAGAHSTFHPPIAFSVTAATLTVTPGPANTPLKLTFRMGATVFRPEAGTGPFIEPLIRAVASGNLQNLYASAHSLA